jgi:hypothetical protein
MSYDQNVATPEIEPLAVTVKTAARIMSRGESSIWNDIAAKELDTVLIGRRRLVLMRSIKRRLGIDQHVT